jgi:glycosyltransferase involved in cell wall biosynthesis
MPPSKVLHLITRNQRRGAEVFALQLVSAFRDQSFMHSLHSLYGEGGLAARAGRLPVDGGLLVKLIRTMRSERPEVVVAHGSATLKYGVAASLFAGNPAIVYRNIGVASHWANSAFKVQVNRLLLRRVRYVVSVSKSTQCDFVAVYGIPPPRTRCILNGVDTALFDPESLAAARSGMRQALGIGDRELAVVTVGSLSQEKDPWACLDLAAALRSRGLSIRYLLAGDGPLRQELETRARALGVADYVHFLGVRQDIPRVLAASDLFVLTSRTEGMPGVLIEAGLASLASVAYNVGGVGEVIEHGTTGLLVSPGDAGKLADSVGELLQGEERRRNMGIRARKRCEARFDIGKVANEYESLFKDILQDRRGGRNGHG